MKAGRVLRFPAWAVRLAAAVLIATTLGLTAYTIVDRPGVGPAKVDRILAEADALVRTGDEAVLPEALERFKQLAETKDAHVASRARYEALGLTRLQTRRRPRAVSTSAAVYVTPQARERARAREMLISYKDVLVEFPGTRASLFAIKRALPSSEQEVFKFDFGGMKAGNRAHQLRMNTLLARRDEVLRVDYSKMRQLDHLVELDPQLLNNPRLRQSILLQRALQAKELSAIASSRLERTKLREDARKDLQTLIRLDPESKAAQLAREALATI